MSTEWTVTLPKKDLSGSKLRCLMLTSLPRGHIASVLSSLVSPAAVVDESKHHWLPGGFLKPAEAKLGECPDFLTPDLRERLTSWWLVNRRGANTPNWDIVSTCTAEGKEGLILVEAKAHNKESKPEGKDLGDRENHEQIGAALNEANSALNAICPGWAITRDSHYQFCNRFGWAWKVASLGIPVILVYLGFLHADEMSRCGKPFVSDQEWRSMVLGRGANFVPNNAWEKRLQTNAAPMCPMIRSLDLRWVSTRAPEGVTE
jgi:hypothetical protein